MGTLRPGDHRRYSREHMASELERTSLSWLAAIWLTGKENNEFATILKKKASYLACPTKKPSAPFSRQAGPWRSTLAASGVLIGPS
jgi:hypothetical protein